MAFDLDGTLAFYGGWRGSEHIGEPIMPMVRLVLQLLAEGHVVKIFTARVSGLRGNPGEPQTEAERSEQLIKAYCLKHIGQELEVTCKKDYGMIRLYDDRCIQVEPNTGRLIV